MKKESKILIGVLAALLVVIPLMSLVMAVDVNGQEPDESDNLLRARIRLEEYNLQRQRCVIWFFKDAEKDTITGTITAHDRSILIVTDAAGNRFNIILPRRWNIGSDVVSLDQLFDEGYISIGETVTLDALKRTDTNENGVTVTTIFCYEITTNSHNLYAVLPVNIDG